MRHGWTADAAGDGTTTATVLAQAIYASLISDYSIYEDTRVKHLRFLSASYPYTIEYSYVQEFDGFLTLPSWRPISSFEMAVEQSTFTLRCDPSYALHGPAHRGQAAAPGGEALAGRHEAVRGGGTRQLGADRHVTGFLVVTAIP